MFSKEEEKELRVEFWNSFQDFTNKRRRKTGGSGKWILDKTGINSLNLRFHFDRKEAIVGIDLETKSLDKRIEFFEKLETVKKQINKALGEETKWELEYIRENKKAISRVYTSIDKVDVLDKETWNRVNMFFFDRMAALQDFFEEYRDYLKYG